MSIPANPTEAPTVGKVWRQLKGNALPFASIWGIILIIWLIWAVFGYLTGMLTDSDSIGPAQAVESPALTHNYMIIAFTLYTATAVIITSLVFVLTAAVPAIYYTTDRCPKPGEIVGILTRKPFRYLLAGFEFVIFVFVGYLFCVIPGILVLLAYPIYVHYVFTTDLDLMTCLSKAINGMFQDFGSYFLVSLVCFLATTVSSYLWFFPYLVVLPMTELYMQNYIHHKGLVRARELA